MSSAYLNTEFIRHIDPSSVNTIFEVGARDGSDSIALFNHYVNSQIYSFECNPLVIDKCKNALEKYERIHFFPFGLGEKSELKIFHPYSLENPGASSFFKRIDYETTQTNIDNVKVETIENICNEYGINSIDILCMDTQGYELNILKGAGSILAKIRFIILEQPKEVPNKHFLPSGMYSKYIGAPSANDIRQFLEVNGFVEIQRTFENHIEDNVMYKNLRTVFT